MVQAWFIFMAVGVQRMVHKMGQPFAVVDEPKISSQSKPILLESVIKLQGGSLSQHELFTANQETVEEAKKMLPELSSAGLDGVEKTYASSYPVTPEQPAIHKTAIVQLVSAKLLLEMSEASDESLSEAVTIDEPFGAETLQQEESKELEVLPVAEHNSWVRANKYAVARNKNRMSLEIGERLKIVGLTILTILQKVGMILMTPSLL